MAFVLKKTKEKVKSEYKTPYQTPADAIQKIAQDSSTSLNSVVVGMIQYSLDKEKSDQ